MKTLSIKQPWATLIIKGYKNYEFRSWATKYRGEFLIHASKTVEKEKLPVFEHLNLSYPTGVILGKVTLTDCIAVTKEFEDKIIKQKPGVYGLSTGRDGYAFKLEDVEEFSEPIPVNGQLGFWEYPRKEKSKKSYH